LTTLGRDVEALAARAIDEWQVPGVAVAVLHGNETLLVEGYGRRDVEAGLPVTADTQFSIGSITKTLTAAGLGLLVDERRLDWAKPVRHYIPEFLLYDAVATERVTVRDLLCHHWGLPRHDWLWKPGDLSREQMLAALSHLEPSHDIRTRFQYQNLGYLVAGMVAERITGLTWEDFTRARLTEKLRMQVSFTAEDLAAELGAAVPYAMDGNTRVRVPRWPLSVTPAGGINASISSVANWLRLLVDRGRFGDEELLSVATLEEMQTPLVHMLCSEFSEIGHIHYGLGFASYCYRGERVVSHDGSWIGWGALMGLVPERGIAVAVLTNRDWSPVPSILVNFVIDRLCAREPVAWLERYRERRCKLQDQQAADRQAHKAAQREGKRPTHDLADYAGSYDHPGYGRMTIIRAGGGLQWQYRGLSAALTHRHFDTFELPDARGGLLPERLVVTFASDREGNIAALSAPLEPAVSDIVFTRVASGDCTDLSFRDACPGNFASGPIEHEVRLDGDGQLTLKSPGQPRYRLVPYRDRTFAVGELDGIRIEFARGPLGAVDQIIFHQPNGTFTGHRAR
jgi:CubicO group peptidase (beta-lactamase class C family)